MLLNNPETKSCNNSGSKSCPVSPHTASARMYELRLPCYGPCGQPEGAIPCAPARAGSDIQVRHAPNGSARRTPESTRSPSDVAPRLALYASGLLKLKGRNSTLGRASMVAEAGGVVLITPLQGLRTENGVNFLESGRLAWALLRRPVGLKELPHGRQTRFHTFWPDHAPMVQPKPVPRFTPASTQ